MYFFWPRGHCEIILETPRIVSLQNFSVHCELRKSENFSRSSQLSLRPEVMTVMQSGCEWSGLYTLIESADILGVHNRRNTV